MQMPRENKVNGTESVMVVFSTLQLCQEFSRPKTRRGSKGGALGFVPIAGIHRGCFKRSRVAFTLAPRSSCDTIFRSNAMGSR